jgi:hypothetical protein
MFDYILDLVLGKATTVNQAHTLYITNPDIAEEPESEHLLIEDISVVASVDNDSDWASVGSFDEEDQDGST